MELRNHPLIALSRFAVLAAHVVASEPRARARGRDREVEIGRLKNILPNSNSDRCFLLIEHEGEGYIGCLFFEDAIFCSQIISIIKTHIGRTIKEVGDLDLSCTL